MTNSMQSLKQCCAGIQFGKITLCNDLTALYNDLNFVIIDVIKSLPETMQTRTLLMLMNHLGLTVKNPAEFFRGFYCPAWSILHWLLDSYSSDRELSVAELTNIKTIHATAMLLHLIDDHLNDGELPATHLTLLLRSQLWMAMNRSLEGLTNGRDSMVATAHDLISDYYDGMVTAEPDVSLDTYCDTFRRQMGTGFLAPVLMLKKLTVAEQIIASVKVAFGSFGIAWRLLDDIQDIPVDVQANRKSAVYHCLRDTGKAYWEQAGKGSDLASTDATRGLMDTLLESRVTAKIRDRICTELDSAAEISAACKLSGYAEELWSLQEPLVKSRSTGEFKNSGNNGGGSS